MKVRWRKEIILFQKGRKKRSKKSKIEDEEIEEDATRWHHIIN
jgi:hypothetical protein